MGHCTVGFVFVILMSIIGQICEAKKSKVISITSVNWKDTLEGEWMIKFYAPTCPASKTMEADYKAFAEWSDYLNIRVAEVNIDDEPGLSGRFIVTALPSIYHVKNGEFRRYTAERHSNALHKYIEEEIWRGAEPVAWYRHPDSIPMSLMSSLFQSFVYIKGFYEGLIGNYGFSTAISYRVFGLATVATGLVLGSTLVFITDCFSSLKAHPPQATMALDAEIEKESVEEENGGDDRQSTGRTSVSGSEQGDGDKRASRDESSEDEEYGTQISLGSSQTTPGWEKAPETLEGEMQIPSDKEEGQGEIRKRNVQKPEDDEKK